jgi:hypothetical protein
VHDAQAAATGTRPPWMWRSNPTGESIMAKGQLTKKMEKKEPAKTFKEKREAKKVKKEEKKKQ